MIAGVHSFMISYNNNNDFAIQPFSHNHYLLRTTTTTTIINTKGRKRTHTTAAFANHDKNVPVDDDDNEVKTTTTTTKIMKSSMSYDDLIWKICLPPDTATKEQQQQWKEYTEMIRSQYNNDDNEELPRVVVPPGGQAVIETYYNDVKIARFGIVTVPGPSTPEMVQTVQNIYYKNNNDNDIEVHAGAIIYMFIESEYRSRDIGTLALEVISYIQAYNGCNYTILIADDKSNEKTLVKWYEKNNYTRAPLLQNLLGSPNEIYGITMIAPTKYNISDNCKIQW